MATAKTPPAIPSRLDEFSDYFELSLATTRKQRDHVYQIRYRVYCEEFGFEPTAAFSNHQEMDEFDCQSIHCLVTHKASGMPAGCARVVMVEDGDRMPMEVHAGDSIDSQFMDSFRDRRDTLCEISRLAVDSAFRRRRREGETPIGHIANIGLTSTERRTFPLIAQALIIGAGAVADIIDRKNCFAIMEPPLSAFLKRSGIDFRRIGSDFEFRGVRAPYYGNIEEMISKAPLELRQYSARVREQFVLALLAAPMVAASPSPGRAKLVSSRCPKWPLVLPTVDFQLACARWLADPAARLGFPDGQPA